MLELQDRKRELATGAFSKKMNADERRRERIANIRLLMDI